MSALAFTVSYWIPVLTFASWAGCFWLGFQIGMALSELRRKLEVEDLERRFKIVNGEAVEIPEQNVGRKFATRHQPDERSAA